MARANAAFYAGPDPLSHFTTAPEISQAFGECLGLWAAVTWQQIGSPDPVWLVELGPGRGTLMADAWRAITAMVPGFAGAARLALVESSPSLRERQRAAGLPATWFDRMEEVPPGPVILIANEFLDALPIRQFVRREGGWVERWVRDGGFVELPADAVAPPGLPDAPAPLLVGTPAPFSVDTPAPLGVDTPAPLGVDTPAPLGVDTPAHLRFDALPPLGVDALPPPGIDAPSWLANEAQARQPPFPEDLPFDAPPGSAIEYGQAARTLVNGLASRLAAQGGAALFLDYGPSESGFGDTLQAVRHHAAADPLAEPGQADLTAHVDFAALARAATPAAVHGPFPMGLFLQRLGLVSRAAMLAQSSPRQAGLILSGAQRLVAAEGMGSLFKALCLGQPGHPVPAGFE